jgi:hypothetical protein
MQRAGLPANPTLNKVLSVNARFQWRDLLLQKTVARAGSMAVMRNASDR